MNFSINKQKAVQHSLFWIGYGAFWHFIFSPEWYNLSSISVSLVYTLSNILAAYTVIYFLVPYLLNSRRILLFLIAMMGVLVATSALHGAALWGFFYLIDPSIPNQFFASDIALPSILGSNSSAILLVLALQQYFSRKGEESRRKEIEKQNLETELKYLKDQLNPHFLFNALNSIYFLIKKDPDLAAERLAGFSDLLRHQLYHTSDEKIGLQQELDNLEKYTGLEKLRMPDDLKLILKLPENMNGELIAPFLLQPLVENAFKYVRRNNGLIDVAAELNFGKFEFCVKNNIEKDKLMNANKGGIGLTNLQRRLELLYPKKHKLIISENTGEFSVNLQILLNQ